MTIPLQQEADSVTNWFEKNDMVISSEKTKLMIVTTDANRATKLTPLGTKFSVSVCNEVKDETNSEKLLGVVMNNQMTWKNHLYGDDENMGLLKELSQRVGMIRKIRNFVDNNVLKTIINGMFTSKLIYGITVYGGVWGLQGIMNEEQIHSKSITKEDMRKLQVLQNSTLRILLRKPRETPVTTLLRDANQMSVHQLVAYHTACQTFKIYRNQRPAYHFNRLFGSENIQRTRAETNLETRVEFGLSLARSSFFYISISSHLELITIPHEDSNNH